MRSKGATADMKKRIIDEQGRIFGAISVVDVIVIILALALIAAVYAKYHVLDKTSSDAPTDEITYQVKVSSVRLIATNTLRAGDTLYSSTGTNLGVITNVDIQDAQRNVALSNGKLVKGPVENRCDVYITMKAPCMKVDGRYFVNQTYEINVNSERDLLTKYNTFRGTIVSITE